LSPSSFQFLTQPLAKTAAVVRAPGVRFTVLTPRLLRLEYDPAEQFEDRPSQAFWFRRQPVPAYQERRSAGSLEIETSRLKLVYQVSPSGFTPQTLSIELKGPGVPWRYGDRPEGNLLGTGRTLDGANGPIHLETGLVSRQGWAVVDDSQSLVFNPEGWLEARPARGALDLYFFGYGHDYAACLKDFTRLAGDVPLVPRWMLGNWWSHFWPYSQDELKALMEDFRQHEIPLSVCIVDMDWHLTQTGNASNGWTGYTWNRALFPDPPAFFHWLHQQGLRTALNLHPAEGVYPHEEAYPQIAAHMGIDPASQAPVPFDIADPHFMRAYFDILHHPLEAQGVDFWWVDWQQGPGSKVANLDPLWFLNHLHFADAARDGTRRPIIFSRWGGLGNHRYPIGFSGDSVVSWDSLAFQPYFTATAANVSYGWWSHDIGGHMHGQEDRELYTRWVQFGVFSPILRLHCTNNAYQERRPWGYDAEVLRVTRQAFQLRHALIPYIYSMAWRNTSQALPVVTPMYYGWPEEEDAYRCPDQYCFGSELVAAPFVTPTNPETRLSRGSVWLPAGDWFNFFDGEYFEGGRWVPLFGSLEEVPVFARAGGIVPLGPLAGWGGTENPSELSVVMFPGANNRLELYEDDGVSPGYQEGRAGFTTFEQTWSDGGVRFTIQPARGDTSLVPPARRYTLAWRGLRQPAVVELAVDGTPVTPTTLYDPATETFSLEKIELDRASRLNLRLAAPEGQSLLSKRDRTPEKVRKLLRAFRCNPDLKQQLDARLDELMAHPALLAGYARQLTEAQTGVLLQML
jgi:alpha-glucosidase (family GH31 glycosyl hydrolase)